VRYEAVRHVTFILQLPSLSRSYVFFRCSSLSDIFSLHTFSFFNWVRYEVNFKWVLDNECAMGAEYLELCSVEGLTEGHLNEI
jgi:hypothetical protein